MFFVFYELLMRDVNETNSIKSKATEPEIMQGQSEGQQCNQRFVYNQMIKCFKLSIIQIMLWSCHANSLNLLCISNTILYNFGLVIYAKASASEAKAIST